MCIVTREAKDEERLVRFVRSPSGEVVPDIARRLPGRGVWVTLSRARVAEAVRKGAFARGFGAEAKPSPDLPDRVAALLRAAAISYMSLARKAGESVAGFGKCETLLKEGKVRVLLHAAEAAGDGCRKLDRLADAETVRVVIFQSGELDLAFGRSNVIHAAIARGGLAEKLLGAVRRIERYDADETA